MYLTTVHTTIKWMENTCTYVDICIRMIPKNLYLLGEDLTFAKKERRKLEL
jgi:hypothetical protein